MLTTKAYMGYDLFLIVPLVAFYFLSKGSLATTASFGIQGFYMIEIGVAVAMQVFLALFDYNNARAWVASLRTGALIYMTGMLAIVVKLG